jgi:CubicO group peptidase (beta-lactamase class C family)
MASVEKGMFALLLGMLASRDLLDFASPVARYWPEFGQGGKAGITVRQAISHHAALHFTDLAQPGDAYRWDKMVDAIARQAPEWPPGTRGAYHTVSIVYIMGEIVARITGMSPWEFYRREITEPLGVDFHLRLTDAELPRVSALYETEHFAGGMTAAPEVIARFFKARGNPERDLTAEERARFPYLRSAGNARAAAKLFAYLAMDGAIAGTRLMSARVIDLMTEVQWYAPCAVWGTPMRTALGLLCNDPDFYAIGPNPAAFGTAGSGGNFAMADRQNRLSVAYSLNSWWPALALGERAKRLVDAVYRCL